MGPLAIGTVVLIPFPYADFSRFKKRPALVAGIAEFDNLILCQITSKAYTSRKAVKLSDSSFVRGGLNMDSYIRPDKLFTIEQSIIEKDVGLLENTLIENVQSKIREIFTRS